VNWNNDSMSCDRARESIADSIIGRGAIADASAVDAHLAGCAACRAYRAECETMWSALGELPVPAEAQDARARFDAALRTERAAAMRLSRSSSVTRRLLIAAGVVGAMALGYGAASWNAARSSNSTRGVVAASTDTSQQYLLLLYDTESTGPGLSPAELDAIVAEYSAWGRGLRAAGKLVSAEKLNDAPSEWFGGSVSIAGGERLGGFFLIRARDAVEARQIAEACPHLKHGGRVELRAIQKT
jgi:hypothetical protein